MVSKELVNELSRQGFTQEKIGKQLGVSRQRVSQILLNYRNSGRGGREAFYINMNMCESCTTERAVALHHKDFNNANDTTSNLEALCTACHGYRHRGTRSNTIFDKLIRHKKNIPPHIARYLFGEDINNV